MAKPEGTIEGLLKEYELTQSALHSINAVAYAGSGLFLTLSLAGAAWFIRPQSAVGWADVARAAVAGAFSILLVLYWRRWIETLRTQNGISAFRAREIEGSLGLRHRRYFSDLEVVTFSGPQCADHDYVHESYGTGVKHLQQMIAPYAGADLLSPFRRLVQPVAAS